MKLSSALNWRCCWFIWSIDNGASGRSVELSGGRPIQLRWLP